MVKLKSLTIPNVGTPTSNAKFYNHFGKQLIFKKKLNILKDKNIVRVKGMNPKFWLFDEYNFQRLDDNDEIFHLLCNFEDVDFDKYFDYS